ncbi:MAG: twin-arginine translocase TatA/TatE family subunit [Kiritimatiellia bacterium]
MSLAFIQNMGPFQILIVLVVVVLLFGSKKIPDLARSLGKAKSEFKKGIAEGEADEEEARSSRKKTKELASDEDDK